MDPRYGAPGLLDTGYRGFSEVVEGFSRFSRLLDANFDAMHGSFASIVRLMDVAGEFFYVIRTFAFVQLFAGGIAKLGRLFRWLLFGANTKKLTQGNQPSASPLDFTDYVHYQNNEQRRRALLPVVLIMLGISLVSAPMLLVKFFRMLKRQHQQLQLENNWDQPAANEDPNQPHLVQAIADFRGAHEMELSFNKDEKFMVLSKPYPDWWEGEINGHRGLFPANFVQPVRANIPPKNQPIDSNPPTPLPSTDDNQQR